MFIDLHRASHSWKEPCCDILLLFDIWSFPYCKKPSKILNTISVLLIFLKIIAHITLLFNLFCSNEVFQSNLEKIRVIKPLKRTHQV